MTLGTIGKGTAFAAIALAAGLTVFAADADIEKDRAAILAMAGAYTVGFHFEETVAIEPGYELKEPYETTAEVELVEVLENQPRFISLQHILVTEGRVVKHWRQDWKYENRDLVEFAANGTWNHHTLSAEEAAGTWSQSVFEVDDSPRYQGYGRWQHGDGLSNWESNWTWRPLPRREYTKRDDYDVLVARNRHTLTHTGWVHEQDNYKLVLRDGKRNILVRETGLNTYDHIDQAKADAARGYWTRTKDFWADVRGQWSEIFASGSPIKIAKTIDEAPLWKAMSNLQEEMTTAAATGTARHDGIHRVLTAYVSNGTDDKQKIASDTDKRATITQ